MNNHRILMLLCICIVLLAPVSPVPAQAEPLCFPEAAPVINHCLDGRLRSFWEQQGGLLIFGYPIGPAHEEQTSEGPVTVQLFERNRLEWHPLNHPPYDVLLGRLGADLLAQQGHSAAAPEQPRPGCRFFAETQQNICAPFLETWRSYGLELGHPGISEAENLALFGLPLTAPHQMKLGDGQQYTVQWFERARLEDHGDQGIRLGLLGREMHGQSQGSPPVASLDLPPPARQPDIIQQPGGFVEVIGSELTRFGQPIRIKGVNYYPERKPWTDMWDYWNGPQIEQELTLARDQLGINTIRILLPYGASGDGTVDADLIRKLRELLQVAGNLDMRVIITLFDFYNEFPDPNTDEEQENFAYLDRLIGNFMGDERILAWDLHNEPDNYPRWKDGNAPRVLTWLGRMADHVHSIAPNHLVTVGMAHYDNLWQPGPDGRRVVDYSDLISFHNYNAADTIRQLDEVRRHTWKPIMLQEFGWPSGPPCTLPEYSEEQQAAVYGEMLAAAEGRVAGIIAWTLRDYHSGPTMRWDTREEHYGLYRPDDTLKPAAIPFINYAASPLPSITKTNVELTENNNRLSGGRAPERVGDTPYYVKSWFRRAWDNLGGEGSFGLPLSQAYIRPRDGKIVQHFTAATLILRRDETTDPAFDALPLPSQAMQAIEVEDIGRQFTEGVTFPPQEPVTPAPDARLFPETGYVVKGKFLTFYDTFLGPWRLGNPISSELVEEMGGVPVTIQYFEKGRLEWSPVTNAVQFGQIGRLLWEKQCRFEQ